MEVADKVQDIYQYYKEQETVLEQGIQEWDGSYWFEAINDHEIESVKMVFEDWETTYVDPPFLMCPQHFLGKFLGVYVRSADGGNQQSISPFFSCYTSESTEPEDIDGPVFLSEGVMDAESIANFGLPSFACLKSTPSYFMIGMLDAIAEEIVFVPDNDEAGEKAKSAFASKCVNMDRWIDFKIIDVNVVEDPGELFEYGFNCRESMLLEQKIFSTSRVGI